nr:MAG TPA: hypothetical protein [Caudoviricetes sp.]
MEFCNLHPRGELRFVSVAFILHRLIPSFRRSFF